MEEQNGQQLQSQVEIEECADTTTDGPRKDGIGVFEWVISAEQAQSIDECEQIVLRTKYEALRDALARRLSTVSQQLPYPAGTPPAGETDADMTRILVGLLQR